MPEEVKPNPVANGATPDVTQSGPAKSAEGAKPDADESKTHIHRLNEEAKQHRLRADAFEKELSGIKSAFKAALGISDEAIPEKVKEIGAQKDAKLRGILLRSEITAAAAKAGAVDPADVYRLCDFADVEVDVEKETVNSAAIEAKLAALKGAKSYLFRPGESPAPTPTPTPAPARPSLSGNGSAYHQWQAYRKADGPGSRRAARFFAENEKDIRPHLGSKG